MIKKIACCLALLISCASQNLYCDKIGLLVMATGRYISFVDPLIKSADKHFCKKHKVTYYIFTDTLRQSTSKVKYIYQPRLGWPFDTMMRFKAYAQAKEVLKTQKYLFACDADMLFVDKVGSEILSRRVATQHPIEHLVHNKKDYSYDRNPESRACVLPGEENRYFAGGFYGGKTSEFIKLVTTLSRRIEEDLKDDIIALWHDESHLNRYFMDFKPTKILSTDYCYPEGFDLPGKKKLMPLNKNHTEMRK